MWYKYLNWHLAFFLSVWFVQTFFEGLNLKVCVCVWGEDSLTTQTLTTLSLEEESSLPMPLPYPCLSFIQQFPQKYL